MPRFSPFVALAALAVLATPAIADSHADCTFDIPAEDFEDADIDRLYECVRDDLAAAYASEGDEIGSVYRDWQLTATGPAAPGFHGSRFLLTFANDVAFEPYTQYPEAEDFEMPVGSILAKESFSLTGEGEPRLGPLFIMTKVEPGVADEYGGWVYSAVRTNGAPMGISQSFCHDCHANFDYQDSLGYPAFHVRLGE